MRIVFLNDHDSPNDLPYVTGKSLEDCLVKAYQKLIEDFGFDEVEAERWVNKARVGSWREFYYGMTVEA